MNYLLIPSSPSGKCVPLSAFSWKMQIAFSVIFAVGLLIVLFFGPNPKRRSRVAMLMCSWREEGGFVPVPVCSGVPTGAGHHT